MAKAQRRRVKKANPRPYGHGSYWFDEKEDTYQARFPIPGRRPVYHRSATKQEAERWLDEQLDRVRAGKAPSGGKSPTVEEFAERWLRNVAGQSAKGKGASRRGPNTMEGYCAKIRNYFIRPYGHFKMAELEREHIEELYTWLRAGQTLPNGLNVAPGIQLASRPLKAQTIRHFHNLLCYLFIAAEKDKPKVIEESPMPRERPGIPEEEAFNGTALTPVELWRIVQEAGGHPNGAAVVTEALLGCRRGEMLGLQWEDVYLDDDPPFVVLRRSVQRVKGQHLQALPVKTKKSRRSLAISEHLVGALRAHQKGVMTGEEWVFPSPKFPGQPMSPEYFHRKVWSPIRASADIKCRPHDLRVTLRTLTHLEGVPEGVSMAYHGWTQHETAMHYTQLKEDAEQTKPMVTAVDTVLAKGGAPAAPRKSPRSAGEPSGPRRTRLRQGESRSV